MQTDLLNISKPLILSCFLECLPSILFFPKYLLICEISAASSREFPSRFPTSRSTLPVVQSRDSTGLLPDAPRLAQGLTLSEARHYAEKSETRDAWWLPWLQKVNSSPRIGLWPWKPDSQPNVATEQLRPKGQRAAIWNQGLPTLQLERLVQRVPASLLTPVGPEPRCSPLCTRAFSTQG